MNALQKRLKEYQDGAPFPSYQELMAIAARMPVWTEVSSKPDSDTTVQLFDKDASEPVWPGYFDGTRWLYIDGVVANPSCWAEMPEGPSV